MALDGKINPDNFQGQRSKVKVIMAVMKIEFSLNIMETNNQYLSLFYTSNVYLDVLQF